mmetsp:Transcript_71383/g.170531  ORF Transcript_71383/g.170531 Transcript_71383/m.170531 type:complete len:200 (+) Transcript_71383:239-838(+)
MMFSCSSGTLPSDFAFTDVSGVTYHSIQTLLGSCMYGATTRRSTGTTAPFSALKPSCPQVVLLGPCTSAPSKWTLSCMGHADCGLISSKRGWPMSFRMPPGTVLTAFQLSSMPNQVPVFSHFQPHKKAKKPTHWSSALHICKPLSRYWPLEVEVKGSMSPPQEVFGTCQAPSVPHSVKAQGLCQPYRRSCAPTSQMSLP